MPLSAIRRTFHLDSTPMHLLTVVFQNSNPYRESASLSHMAACLHSVRGGIPSLRNIPPTSLGLPPVEEPKVGGRLQILFRVMVRSILVFSDTSVPLI